MFSASKIFHFFQLYFSGAGISTYPESEGLTPIYTDDTGLEQATTRTKTNTVILHCAQDDDFNRMMTSAG
jgi:hypothetical protein